MGKYWRVILDGTGLFYFKEKHCDNCLCTVRQTEDGKKVKLYYHKVLEAKNVLSDNVVISLGTEFIENEKEDVSKQDCEINAAKRLMKRMKKEYPRLVICIQGDALYATEPMMKLCRDKYHWEYIFTQKDTRQKKLNEGFEWIKSDEDASRKAGVCKEKGTAFYANYVEELAGKTEIMNVFEYEYEIKDKEGKKQTIRFQWISSLELTDRNLEEMILAGRGRWKIENEGFNNQKNGIYRIEHLNSKNSNAMKNHYLLTQIADWCKKQYSARGPNGETIVKSKKWFGFRLHLIADATYEIPVAYSVTKASNSEKTETQKLLEQMEKVHTEWLDECKYFLGDKGYDSSKIIAWLEHKEIMPIIDIRNCWKDGEETHQYKNTKLVYNYKGTVWYEEESGEKTKLSYKGYDKSTDSLRYGFKPQKHDNRIFRIRCKEERRIFTPVARNSYKWKRLYKKRTGVERINGRIDRDYKFERHSIRGLKKMTVFLTVTFLIYITMVKAKIEAGEKEHLCKLYA